MSLKVMITGALGKCGSCLFDLPYECTFLSKKPTPYEAIKDRFVQGDLSDAKWLRQQFSGLDVVVHLAGSSSPESSWEDVLNYNILGMKNVMEAAAGAGIETFIFASSNHVVGMYEVEHRPQIYDSECGIKLDKDVELRPDSYYGVSKAFGENLGRLISEKSNMKFIALRIGAVLDEQNDHPYAYAEQGVRKGSWTKASNDYVLQEKRLRAIWQSRRDFRQMIELSIENRSVPSFDIFYGVSDNRNSWLDIEHAKHILGYSPEDSADSWSICPD